MKKIKVIIAAVAMLSLVSSSAVYADGFAPGEGLYAGAFFGAGTGIVQPKVTTTGAGGTNQDGTYEAAEGGLGLFGIQGGGMLGYGYKAGDIYIGIEMDAAASDEKFELTSSTAVITSGEGGGEQSRTKVTAEKNWVAGFSARLGYYINPTTLFSVKGGVAASEFDVDDGINQDTFYGGGARFGVALDSQLAVIDPNLSLRIEYLYTDYMTAPISGIGSDTVGGNATYAVGIHGSGSANDSEITGSDTAGRIGLTYSFFDVNSLF
jgi:hypothetical protein